MGYDRDRWHGFRGVMFRGLGRASALVSGVTVLVLVGAVSVAAEVQQAATAATSLVFDRVTVVDVEQGKLVADQRVVIAGNRIQTVGPADQVRIPRGAQLVEARGKYLIPGLWDMHIHPEDATALLYPLSVANGVTGMRDAWSAIPLDTLVLWRREILASTRVGPPRQLLAGLPFNGVNYNREAGGYIHIMDSLVAAGANFLKLYPFTPAAAAAARRVGIPFGGHLYTSAIEASDSGIRIIDHAGGSLSDLCLGRQASVELCRPVAERFKQNGTWWVPTLSRNLSAYNKLTRKLLLGGGGRGNGGPDSASGPVAIRLSEVVAQFWSGSSPQGNWLHNRVHVGGADSLRLLSIAQRVGLPILAGTDGGKAIMHEQPPGFALHAELALYVTEGLTPLEALQTATLNPAKLLRGTDSLGTVAPGKLADLVLLDADPLADITNTTTIRAVVANGRYFDRAALDDLLAEVRAKAKQNP